jgi:hypothetical protein
MPTHTPERNAFAEHRLDKGFGDAVARGEPGLLIGEVPDTRQTMRSARLILSASSVDRPSDTSAPCAAASSARHRSDIART